MHEFVDPNIIDGAAGLALSTSLIRVVAPIT